MVLPVLAILALVAGVALAPARRRALVIGASMIVGTLVLLLLGVQVLRALYLDDLEKALLVPQVATVLFDDVTTPLRLVGALDGDALPRHRPGGVGRRPVERRRRRAVGAGAGCPG